jgi:hypothetical protein
VRAVKRRRAQFGCLLLLPLLFQAALRTGRPEAPPTGPVVYLVYLSSGYYEYFPVYAFANSTAVQYSLMSNVSVSTAFMTSAQFQLFNDSNGLVSNSMAYHNGTSADETIRVGPGAYVVLVYAYMDAANATLSVSVFPNNPLGRGPPRAPQPTGIVSYGLINQSGVDNPYSVASTDVIGLASISSMQASNASASSVGSNPSGATLQLNSMLVVEEEGSEDQVYWCQNTPDFVTATSQLAMSDNVWNASRSGVLSNSSISSQGGAGYVSKLVQNGTTLYYYAVIESNSTYSLPLGLVLLMNATVEPGTGVLVQFGAETAGGLGAGEGTNWFDNVTIHDPAAKTAYFATNGNYSTPIGNFYDTELVFAGEGGGEATNFTSLRASLGLFYANGTSTAMSAFPSYFSFGGDTAEGADNLKVSYLGDGMAGVSVGAPSYAYLGSASGAYALASVEAALNFPGTVNNASTTTVATTTTWAQTAKSTTSQSTKMTSAGGIPEFPFQILATPVSVLLITLAYLFARRRSASPNTAIRL